MQKHQIFDLYREYKKILSIVSETSFKVSETEGLIDITIDSKFSLDLLRELSLSVKFFDVNCNPFPLSFNEVMDDLNENFKKIDEITSISINKEKFCYIKDIVNIDYIFFNKKYAIKSIKNFENVSARNKINIGIMDSRDLETELFNFIDLQSNIHLEIPKPKQINSEVSDNILFYLSNNKDNKHHFFYNPYAFLITSNETKNEEIELAELVKKRFYLLMLESLSDKEKSDRHTIRGEKNVDIIFNTTFSTVNYVIFLKILNFLISHYKYTEKFIITKKVMTLYLNNDEDLNDLDNKLPDIWKTINHYYDHYVEDNIKDFFKSKDQLLKEAMNVSKIIYEQTDKVANSINASIISILILFLTTLFKTMSDLNIKLAGIFILFFSIFSYFFYSLTKKISEDRYRLSKDQFEHFVNEISLIQKDEAMNIKTTYIDNPYKTLSKTLETLSITLIVINIIIFLFFAVFVSNKYFNFFLIVS